MENITRRDLVKSASIAAGAAAVAGAALSAPKAYAMPGESFAGEVEVPKFLIAPEPITDIAETKDYDIVVVGAGAAGVPAVLTAIEAGASVACLQKESVGRIPGQRRLRASTRRTPTPPRSRALVSSSIAAGHAYRPEASPASRLGPQLRRDLASWLERPLDRGRSHSSPKPSQPTEFPGGTVTYHQATPLAPSPYTTGDAHAAPSPRSPRPKGAEFFYETPGVQLVKDEPAAVTGVIGQTAEGTYIQFNAAKGVIVATGDYQNDLDMCSYYLPDLDNFERKQFGKTGDGHKMVVWAGGKIEDGGHTKMLHDFDAGPMQHVPTRPILAVKDDGTRFCDETTGPCPCSTTSCAWPAGLRLVLADLRQRLPDRRRRLAGHPGRSRGGHEDLHARGRGREGGRAPGATCAPSRPTPSRS